MQRLLCLFSPCLLLIKRLKYLVPDIEVKSAAEKNSEADVQQL